MSYVLDSSALIYLGKIGLLNKLKLLGEKFIIPSKVYQEVVVIGEEKNEPEVSLIKELIVKKVFLVKIAKGKIEVFPSLSEADKEVLLLAKETNSIAIIDEIYANNVAESYGIESHGTIYLILKLLKEKIIKKNEAIDYVDKIIKIGFYLSAEKYKSFLKIIGNI